MNDIQKEIDQAFRLISSIYVAEDNVDRMATAKNHLRTAYQLAATKLTGTEEKKEKEEKDNG